MMSQLIRKTSKNAVYSLGLFCSTWLIADQPVDCDKPCSITVKHIEGGGVGYNTGYTTLQGLIRPSSSLRKITPFLDLRGHIFDNGDWAANAGVGMRGVLANRIYGISTYYDYRGTHHLNYNQMSVGLETLGEFFDVRMNGYLPFGRKTSSPYDTRFGRFSGHYLLLSQKVELAMKGIDAEVGFHLGNCNAWNFYAAIGPYCFGGSYGPNAWGGKARASVSYGSWVTLELIESLDNVFHNNIQGQLAFSFPLGKKTCKGLCSAFSRPVYRNEIIVLNHRKIHPVAINPSNGLPYYFTFVNNTSSSQGTFESPYPSLALAQANSLPGQIIYVFAGDGTVRNMDHGIVLQSDQKLWGAGVAQPIRTTQGIVTIPQMSASFPQITNIDLLGVGATLASGNQVRGITFKETSGQAIFGIDPVSVDISLSTFTGCGTGDLGIYPVLLQASSPLTVVLHDNTFLDNPNAGVFINLMDGVSSSHIEMTNNTAYNNASTSGAAGILTLQAHGVVGSCSLRMSGNIFNQNNAYSVSIVDLDTPHEGSFALFSGIFTDNIFTENLQGINFNTNADTFEMLLQRNNLSGCANGSLIILGGQAGSQSIAHATILIDSNQIDAGGNYGDGMTISPSGQTLSMTVTNNSITDNQGTALVSYFNQPGPSVELQMSGNVIANNQNLVNFNAAGGISIDGFASIIATIADNAFDANADGNKIGSYGDSFTATLYTSSITLINNLFTGGDTFDFESYANSPEIFCLTVMGNTGLLDPTYIAGNNRTGSFFMTPCNYDTVNAGGFSLSGVTGSADCLGTACP